MLSIIIPNYKNPALLRLALKSLLAQKEGNFDMEIIVVDIESSVETRNVVLEDFREHRIAFIPFNGNIGYTRGVNEGIKASRGDYVFIMNADVLPLKGALASIYNFMKADPKIGLLGPKLLNFDGSRQNSCFRFYNPFTILYRRTFLGYLPFAKRELDRFTMRGEDFSQPMKVDWVMGSALLVSRKAIDKVGLMDENLILYFSEVDWARRFWENGYQVVYYPYAEMYHYHRRESKGRFDIFDALMKKQTRWHIRDGMRYFRKYGFKI